MNEPQHDAPPGEPDPIRRLESSVGLGWRNVIVQAAREDPFAEPFMTRAVPELLLVIVTSGTYRIASAKAGRWTGELYHPGSVGLTPPGHTSTLRWASTGQEPLRSVHIRLPRTLLHSVVTGSDPRSDFDDCDALHVGDAFVSSIGKAMGAALTTKAPALYADSLAHTLAAHLLLRSGRTQAAVPAHALGPSGLQRVLDHMHDNLAEDVQLTDLAALVNLSPFYFLRLFRRATGSTPHSYLVGLRLRHGAELLRHTLLPVSQVAARCGYRSAGRFSEAFRKQFGASPSRYRSSAG